MGGWKDLETKSSPMLGGVQPAPRDPAWSGLATLSPCDRLAGLVVKASVSGSENPGFESRLRRDFSGSSHISDLKIDTPVATLPGAWRYRVSAGTSRPSVSIL